MFTAFCVVMIMIIILIIKRTCNALLCICRSILELHSEWYRQCWNEIDSSELLTNTENELDLLSELPQKIIRSWDIYQNVLNAVLTVQANAPILERLKRYVHVPLVYYLMILASW